MLSQLLASPSPSGMLPELLWHMGELHSAPPKGHELLSSEIPSTPLLDAVKLTRCDARSMNGSIV